MTLKAFLCGDLIFHIELSVHGSVKMHYLGGGAFQLCMHAHFRGVARILEKGEPKCKVIACETRKV